MFLKELTSFLAALLFAIHPIHTEAVSFYILDRFIESLISLLILSKVDIVNLLKYNRVVKYDFFIF